MAEREVQKLQKEVDGLEVKNNMGEMLIRTLFFSKSFS